MIHQTRRTGIYQVKSQSYDSPYRYWVPDLHVKNPSYGGKAGIYGALSEPAEYLARYAWKHYGGTEKTRALGLLAQKTWKERYFRWRVYNYGYAPKVPKKNGKNGLARKTKKSTFVQGKYYYRKQKCVHPYDRNCARKRKGTSFRSSRRKSRIPL